MRKKAVLIAFNDKLESCTYRIKITWKCSVQIIITDTATCACELEILAKETTRGRNNRTCNIIFGSTKNGNRSTANKDSDVNAFAGVRTPPNNENSPNETTITTTGILFKTKLLHCERKRKKWSLEK